MNKVLLSTLLAALAASASAQSGNPAPMTPIAHPDPRIAAFAAQTTRARMPGQVALSPDGTTLAWTLGGRGGSVLHLAPLSDPSKDKIVDQLCSVSSPVWSPDSKTIAFTSTPTCSREDRTPVQPQIFLYTVATGETKQLTHLKGIFQQVAFSPDGSVLAFLFVENATRNAGALAAMKPWSGIIGEDGVEIQRVYGVNVATGESGFMTAADLHVYEFAFNPAAKVGEIAFIAAPPPGENTWWIAKLYTRTHGGPMKVVFDPNTTHTALHGLQIAVPRFSPDGSKIAFIGGLMSDQGSTGGDIWVVPSKGGDPVDITPNIDGTPTYIVWEGPNAVGFAEDRSGHTVLSSYFVSTGTRDAELDLGEVNITGGPIKMAVSVANNGAIAFVESGHNQPPEIFAGEPASLQQITHLNDGAKSTTRTESVEWKNEGFRVQGWLTYPKDYDSAKKYPIIVQVHGGPSASASARWGGSLWSELGYFEFSPNPRGSFGQGEKFTAANIKDFGYGDLRDITTGLDAIEKQIPAIDHTREGLTGWSYGGFMTMFGVTQTTRFRAAVAGAGIANWQSYYGENSIDQWMVPFFGATVYDDPAVYAKSSAITFIHNVKTPTLVMVGDRDGECPAPQSFEFWHALRAEGVTTQLVIYPNEGHGFRDPAHIRDREERQAAWFAQYMPAQ
jgi:dipeptidyl aminopeptidase/acylaminoacyl peptidase